MDRRTFMGRLAGASAVTAVLPRAIAAATQSAPKARNVVLLHGLFADGSCWSEVILTTLEDSVAAARRAVAMQDGPTVLVGHSFSGMIVTEVGVDPKVTALVYVAARAPDATRRSRADFRRHPHLPASSGPVTGGSSARPRFCGISRAACRLRRRAFCMLSRCRSHGNCWLARRRRRPGGRSRVGTRCRLMIARSIPISSGSWQNGWAPTPSR